MKSERRQRAEQGPNGAPEHYEVLVPLDFREIYNEIPALKKLDVEIESYEDLTPIDSSDVTTELWSELARIIRDNYGRFDGFVILHGTDTMAYTASALSFMLENLAKPVVFTGSQIPIGVLRTDGRENLVTAVEIASARNKQGQPMVPEVAIYFQNKLFRANRTTKWSAEQLNAFTSENYPPLAEVGVAITYNTRFIHRPKKTDPELHISTDLCREVTLVRLFPGMERHILRSMLDVPGLKGVVLQTFGAGNTPTAGWFFDALCEVIARNVAVVNVTQCIAGGVLPIYESGRRLAEAGIVSGRNMTTEAALTKLMYILGKGLPADDAAAELNRPLRGEFTV